LLGYATSATQGRETKYWALVALASTILVAEKKIKPFIETLVPVFFKIISSPDAGSEGQNIKGQTLMCAGRVIAACGKDQIDAQTLNIFTEFGLQCL